MLGVSVRFTTLFQAGWVLYSGSGHHKESWRVRYNWATGQDAMEVRHRFSCFWIPTLREGLWLTPQTTPFLGCNLKWAKRAGIRTQSSSFCIQHFWANVTRTASPWKLSTPSLGCRWDVEEKKDPSGTHSMKSLSFGDKVNANSLKF